MTSAITLASRLANCYRGAVYDVLRAKGYLQQTLPHSIRPLNLEHKLAGRIFTIEDKRDDSLDAHQSLLRWCELLSKAPTNTVLICQTNDHNLAHTGELSSETLASKEGQGCIMDGDCWDSAFIETLGFPIFCKYFTPVDVVGKWAATAFGEPIQIGDVAIRSPIAMVT